MLKNERGQGLFEVLLAVALISGILYVAMLFFSMYSKQFVSQEATTATSQFEDAIRYNVVQRISQFLLSAAHPGTTDALCNPPFSVTAANTGAVTAAQFDSCMSNTLSSGAKLTLIKSSDADPSTYLYPYTIPTNSKFYSPYSNCISKTTFQAGLTNINNTSSYFFCMTLTPDLTLMLMPDNDSLLSMQPVFIEFAFFFYYPVTSPSMPSAPWQLPLTNFATLTAPAAAPSPITNNLYYTFHYAKQMNRALQTNQGVPIYKDHNGIYITSYNN
jgi:hypothetical protein